jgi:signal transduction histidine kinase
MRIDSLALRLLLTSALWVSGTLVLAGLLLVFLFRQHIEQRFDRNAREHLEELVALSELGPGGELQLSRPLFDPRFARPHSGWYWQVLRDGTSVAQSTSLWYERLPVRAPAPGGEVQSVQGPRGESLRALVQLISLPEAEQPLLYVLAEPVADIEQDVRSFTANLVITLAALGLGLLGAMWLQVRFGLAPLRQLGRALAQIRAGRAARLPGTFPREVQPVVGELNALLDHNAALLERARTQAGNLAHALKNPMTVIRNEAQAIPGESGEVLREQVAAMTAQVQRHLSQARAAGAGSLLGARTPLANILVELRESLGLLYRERGLDIRLDGLAGLQFQGDAQDLEEMLGNLMDNACKWTRHRVQVRAWRDGERLHIRVEDEGPGIPDQARAQALDRGRRLDEAVPGSGLGLAIVRDLAELYRGRLELSASPLGGLCAELELPAVW